MSEIRVVEYEFQGKSQLALEVVRDSPGKAQFINTEGESIRISPQRIWRRHQAVVRHLDDPGAFVRNMENEVLDRLSRLDLKTLWEILQGEADRLKCDEVCQIAFEQADLASRIALYRAIRDYPAYFRVNRDDTIVPRDPETVHSMMVQEEQVRLRERQREEFITQVILLIRNPFPEGLMALSRSHLDTLRRFALSGDEETRWQQAANLTASICEGARIRQHPLPLAAFEILHRIGFFSPLDCPASLSLGLPWSFSQEVIQSAREMALGAKVPEVSAKACIVTIDDEETLDIDDAISLVRLPGGGVELSIHIADPASCVEVGTPVELEARRRATSVYLPVYRAPMFPGELSEDILSLVAGKPRSVITFTTRLDDRGNVEDYRICSQVIQVTHRLSYDQVDAHLRGESGLPVEPANLVETLHEVAGKLHEIRLQAGAVELRLPEAKIRVKEEGDICVKILDPDSMARKMVSECMVLANTVAGRTARAHGLNVIYRTQRPPDSLGTQGENSGVFSLVRKLKKGELSCHPAAHFGLGVDVYLQASSPIRRYADFLAVLQLKAWMAGKEPPFAASDLMPILGNAEAVVDEVARQERRSVRYWLMTELKRRMGMVTGLILEVQRLRAQVMLEELALRVQVQLQEGLPVGERILLRVLDVDPLRDQAVLEHVRNP